MTVSVVQTPQRATTVVSNIVNLAYGTNPTAGNLLAASWNVGASDGTPTATVSSSNNGTWPNKVNQNNNDILSRVGINFVKNCSGGADTVTLTSSILLPGAFGNCLIIYEISGVSVTDPDIASNSAQASSSSVANAGNITTTAANAILLAVCACYTQTPTGGTDYTLDFAAASGVVIDGTQHRIVSATGTYSTAFATNISFWAAAAAAFQEDVGGGGGSAIKTINGLVYASIKTVNGLAIASMKSRNGLT